VEERTGTARLLLAVVGASAVGLAGTNVLPLLLGALSEGLALGAGATGLIGSVELAAVAIASLAAATQVHRWSRRGLALVGAGIALLGHVVSALVGDYGSLLLARGLAGLGEGLALAAANAASAGAPDPERLFAQVALVGGLGAAVLLAALPFATEGYGYPGGFGVLAGVCIGSVPLILWLPRPPAGGAAARVLTVVAGTRSVRMLIAALTLAAGEGALWAFTERIGNGIGLGATAIGGLLAACTAAGLGGAALASALGTRLGRVGPLALGLLLLGLATIALGQARGAGLYTAGLLAWGLSFFFVTPYLLGTAAALDRRGRVVAASSGMTSIGVALGPALGGFVVASAGMPALGWLVCGCAMAALALTAPVALWLDRTQASGA
jgi:predicted MFS family arabinose efflux permease